MKSIFKGSCTALITPFSKDGKQIDFAALKKQIDFQLSNFTDALLILGTTGEASTISDSDKVNLVEFVASYVQERVPVIVGVGSNSTETTIKNVKRFQNMPVDAFLVVTPYYNKCTQGGLLQHYKAIAEASRLPIILYNVPSRTGVNITPETVKILSENKKIVGLKEASGNINQISKILQIVRKDFAVYCGDDYITLPVLTLGAKGVISVASNVIPKQISLICKNFFENKLEKAKEIQFACNDFINSLFIEVNPIPVKKAMQLMLLDSGTVRLPLTEISKDNLNILKNEMIKLNLLKE